MEAYDWVGQDPTWVEAPGMMIYLTSFKMTGLQLRYITTTYSPSPRQHNSSRLYKTAISYSCSQNFAIDLHAAWLITFHVFKPYFFELYLYITSYISQCSQVVSSHQVLWWSLYVFLTSGPTHTLHFITCTKHKSQLVTQIYPNSRCSNTLTSEHYLCPHILLL